MNSIGDPCPMNTVCNPNFLLITPQDLEQLEQEKRAALKKKQEEEERKAAARVEIHQKIQAQCELWEAVTHEVTSLKIPETVFEDSCFSRHRNTIWDTLFVQFPDCKDTFTLDKVYGIRAIRKAKGKWTKIKGGGDTLHVACYDDDHDYLELQAAKRCISRIKMFIALGLPESEQIDIC